MDDGPTAAVPMVLEAFASSTLTWIIAGIAAYWLALIAIRQRNLLPDYVGTQGPIITIHTKRGRTFLDRLSGPKRFWRAWANFGVGIAVVVMVSMFFMLVVTAYASFQSPGPSVVQQPRNALAIPGVNDFLPLSAAPEIVFGLLVGLVVHEGGHGLLCRVEDIDIESMGVAMLAIIPMGAFVEPDQEDQYEASRGGQTRMFAAGVTFNFAIAILAFALLFGPIAGAIAVAPGAAVGGVVAGSPAAADIEPNDRITAIDASDIDGQEIEDNDHFESVLDETTASELTVELNGETEAVVERSLLVTAAVEDGPTGITIGDRILEVGGESVTTERSFYDAVGADEVATLTIENEDGDQRTEDIPIGAYALVNQDGPLVDAGVPAGSQFIITEFNGERLPRDEAPNDALTSLLSETDPGDEVTVAGYLDGERETYTATLGDRSQQTGGGTLGFQSTYSVSGLELNDMGVQLYPANEFLVALGGGEGESAFGSMGETFLGKAAIAIFLPIFGFVGALPFNFAGFTGGIQNFYEAQGSLAILGDGTVLLAANLLFWTAWINVNLGFVNCIPAFPLDGGHILRNSTEAIVSRLPFEATRGTVRAVTTTIGLTMLASFLMMFLVPQFVAG